MGLTVKLGKKPIMASGYSVTEGSSPTSVGDTTGEVGSLSMDMPAGNTQPWFIPKGERLELTDTRRGRFTGRVRQPGINYDQASMSVEGVSDLAKFVAYNITAKPFTGTLHACITYYASLAGITQSIRADGIVGARTVTVLGWQGELWPQVKALLAANRAELTLVDGEIILRSNRQHTLEGGLETARSIEPVSQTLAEKVEVYHYNAEAVDRGLLYPMGDPLEESVITINAGEMVEQELEISASVLSIEQPVCVEVVDPTKITGSEYSIVGNDGLPVKPDAWNNKGGWVRVDISEDSQSLVLRAQAPRGLPAADGTELTTYSIAVASGESNQYSTLRIVGNAILFSKRKYTFMTGVPKERAESEIGTTIDNPFMTDLNNTFAAGALLARQYSGRDLSMSGSAATVRSVKDGVVEQQIFGNVGGARVFDRKSRHWFRVRQATITPEGIQYTADLDTTIGDRAEISRTHNLTLASRKALNYTLAEATLRGVPEA